MKYRWKFLLFTLFICCLCLPFFLEGGNLPQSQPFQCATSHLLSWTIYHNESWELLNLKNTNSPIIGSISTEDGLKNEARSMSDDKLQYEW